MQSGFTLNGPRARSLRYDCQQRSATCEGALRMRLGHWAVACLMAAMAALPVCADDSATTLAIPATTSAINSRTPLSQRVVAYDMSAKYNATAHSLEGTETLTYHNLSGQPLDTFPFHLYLNAFQPTATWVREGKREHTRGHDFEKWDAKSYG